MAAPEPDPSPPFGGDDTKTLDLLGRVKEGDSAAFGELYERYHDELLFAVRAHLGPALRSKLESEDILQSVAVDAFRALPRIRANTRAGLKHYLHAMVVNKIRGRADHFGAEKRAGDVALSGSRADAIADPRQGEPAYHDSERFERLERALEALPDDLRRVVVLRKVDGLSSKEVADLIGKSDDSVRKTYSRAMARVAAHLSANGDDAA